MVVVVSGEARFGPRERTSEPVDGTVLVVLVLVLVGDAFEAAATLLVDHHHVIHADLAFFNAEAADAVDSGDGVVVVTDLFGGSPSNLSLLACRPDDRRILYGANLPMLIKLAKSRQQPVGDAVRSAMDAGKKYINTQNVSHD